MNIQEFLPKNKFDIEAFAKTYELSDEQFLEIAHELVSFVEDANYPCYQAAVEVLLARQTLLTEVFIHYLSANDWIWKYWFLTDVFDKLNIDIKTALFPKIKELSTHTPTDDDELSVVLIAKKIVTKK